MADDFRQIDGAGNVETKESFRSPGSHSESGREEIAFQGNAASPRRVRQGEFLGICAIAQIRQRQAAAAWQDEHRRNDQRPSFSSHAGTGWPPKSLAKGQQAAARSFRR